MAGCWKRSTSPAGELVLGGSRMGDRRLSGERHRDRPQRIVRSEQAPNQAMLADAELADVTFVDPQNGWAVGHGGVIRHTADGGEHWTLQASHVDCRLSSVFFVDANIGWAAGGFTHRTRTCHRHHPADARWRRTLDARPQRNVARHCAAGAFDAAHGWALGATSAFFLRRLRHRRRRQELVGAGLAEQPRLAHRRHGRSPIGELAGRASQLGIVRRRAIEPAVADVGLRRAATNEALDNRRRLVGGRRGLVLKTQDLGKSWQTPEADIPTEIASHFDLSAVEVRGPHCWIAGTPGTRVLHTADGGRTWRVSKTGQPLPITALTS